MSDGHYMRLDSLTSTIYSIVEFANQEDAQRAIRELSEQLLLGRPVFIREVGNTHSTEACLIRNFRIASMSRASVRRRFQAKLEWLWQDRVCMPPLLLARHPTITSTRQTRVTSCMLGT